MAEQEEGNIRQEFNNGIVGLNTDQTLNQLPKGQLSYALNAAVENFDSNSVNYQNELGNEFCVKFPEGYVLIGEHFIIEKNKHVFFITNPVSGDSQIGYMDNNDCEYRVLVNAPCLNFNIDYPIHKIVHRITNCSTEIYWTDGFNPRRYLDIDDIPKILRSGSPLCSPIYTDDLDCNQLKLQPNFNIPNIEVVDVVSGGNLKAGTYQFAVQYSDPQGNPFTSYYSVTNPTPIADTQIATVNFDYAVGKSINVNVSNLDTSGQFQYFNLAVIKTINGISSVELVGTYFIDNYEKTITYSGQFTINLVINDIFERFPYYEIAKDLTVAQDVLIWDQLVSIDRINYQQIANKITLQWETWRIPPSENYADETNATKLRGYLRDEVYAFEIMFLLDNGKQTDGFHIPGRMLTSSEKTLPNIPETDPDFIGNADPNTNDAPYWKIYNTASVSGFSPEYTTDEPYKGPYQFGEFAYWESTDEYPCNVDLWGELAGQKIRHHKFPDVNISPIYESKIFLSPEQMEMGNTAIFPIGVKIDPSQIRSLIDSSNLTREQKESIVGFKIVRGDRSVNKSVIAKGMLRNVGEYQRDEQSFFFPNYPYNDLNKDPFLTSSNNAYQSECFSFDVIIDQLSTEPVSGNPIAKVQYNDCSNGKLVTKDFTKIGTYQFCSVGKPRIILGDGRVGYTDYDVYTLDSPLFGQFKASYEDRFDGPVVKTIGSTERTIEVAPGSKVTCVESCNGSQIDFVKSVRSGIVCGGTELLDAFKDENRNRQIFSSPETSFGQPFLGNVLKTESVMFGSGKGHFVEVEKNAKYKLLTEAAQVAALDSSAKLGAITTPFNAVAMFTAYQAYLTIYVNGITRKNYAYSFNSIADYNYSVGVPDQQGVKQRKIETSRYLIPRVQSVSDVNPINNWNRETSVFVKTNDGLPYPDKSPNMLSETISIVSDKSRFTISEAGNCAVPGKEETINVVSYYASMKNVFDNQWGQLYSYETIETGYQYLFKSPNPIRTVFGGDTFIGRFTYKTKVPFFIDNRVNAPDDSDIFYDEIGNIAYPRYWHSARSILKNYNIPGQGIIANIISYKAHNFDCPNNPIGTDVIVSGDITTTTTTTTASPDSGVEPSSTLTYYDGYFYLFAYGIPNFYCESSYNLDLRQAFNDREGNFWPRVSNSIPDDWLQEHFVSILNDNTYYYNTTFSKQNRENTITHLPPDWSDKLCFTNYPFRAIYSDPQNIDSDNRINNWLIYRAVSYYDFPQNYGNLVSLDGIQNKAILARFENKTLMYNNLLTIDTSNPQAAYIGNPTLFKGAPPIDFAETDLGYVGTQHVMLLKIPQGQVSVDAKRGQVFLIQGTQINDISGFGSGMNRFFVEHLPFQMYKHFPTVDIDNHFKGIGLHSVYDAVYDRIILTKLDYAPKSKDVKYDEIEKRFYVIKKINNFEIREYVNLKDQNYFCNVSWTLSYNLNTGKWISFHSYIPNWYIAENNFFYSGINDCCEDYDFIVGTLVPTPSTTTTTTTKGTGPITTTTTTTQALDCELVGTILELNCSIEGTAVVVSFDCDLVGNASTEETTTTTTTSSTTTTTTTTEAPIPCGVSSSYSGGEAYPTTNIVSLGSDTGNVDINYNAITVPDRFIVRWNGSIVIDSGYRGGSAYDIGGGSRSTFTNSLTGRIDPVTGNTYPDFATYNDDGYPRIVGPGSGTASFDKNLASPATATVEVYAPIPGTAWDFTLTCPGTTTTTSSTTTTTTTTLAPDCNLAGTAEEIII